LRLLEPGDLALTRSWRNKEIIRRWFVHSDPISSHHHEDWYRGYTQRDGDFVFIIEETEVFRRPIGQVSLYHIDPVERSAEFGRLLIGEMEARGQGLARQATLLLLAHAFDVWALAKIRLEVFANNLPALAIYRACGFTPTESKDPRLVTMQLTPDRFVVARQTVALVSR
jgi:RimJ/RimL family protein N-acetyltransferase